MVDFHGDRTLGEIEKYDLDNIEHLLKHSKMYNFSTIKEVTVFSGSAMNVAMMKHGINLAVAAQYSSDKEHDAVGKAIDRMLKEKNMHVEERMHYKGKDRWRCGLYVYKDNEIVDFIGAPDKEENSFTLTGFTYFIRTTVIM